MDSNVYHEIARVMSIAEKQLTPSRGRTIDGVGKKAQVLCWLGPLVTPENEAVVGAVIDAIVWAGKNKAAIAAFGKRHCASRCPPF